MFFFNLSIGSGFLAQRSALSDLPFCKGKLSLKEKGLDWLIRRDI